MDPLRAPTEVLFIDFTLILLMFWCVTGVKVFLLSENTTEKVTLSVIVVKPCIMGKTHDAFLVEC